MYAVFLRCRNETAEMTFQQIIDTFRFEQTDTDVTC